MSSPLQFYRTFKQLLIENGIRSILTSGMACVEYGIQETTKDTDWVIHPEDISKLVDALCHQEKGLSGSNWRISYRNLFGAPLMAEYHQGGWSTHLAVHDEPNSPEHHIDLFGAPPRLTVELALANACDGIADVLVVAQMKKTDRSKDWPIVNALALQGWFAGDITSLLHIREAVILIKAWKSLSEPDQALLALRRPLLTQATHGNLEALERLLFIEQTLWSTINRERYGIYQHEWKEFYRRWQKDQVGAWPSSETFSRQHACLITDVRQHQLPQQPLGTYENKIDLYERALQKTKKLLAATDKEISYVRMPLGEVLP